MGSAYPWGYARQTGVIDGRKPTAISFGATARDIPGLDLGYAPPYSSAVDVLQHAANVIDNKLPRDKEIIAFCKISLRGWEAQRILEGEGFTNVSFMEGGLAGWPYALDQD